MAWPRLRVQAVEWVLANRELVAVLCLMALAAALRLWGVDAKALHHDESLHAQYSWYLYDGAGYKHDPLMHGPFLFHAGAAIFFLFGDTDFTIRLLPALFGTAMVGLPYLLRRQIGMQAVLIAAVLIAVSPTLLYVSRFFRGDIYVAFFTFAMVICAWRYLEQQRSLYLYLLAGTLALSFTTLELTYITVAVLIAFLDLMLAVELGKRRKGEEKKSDTSIALRTLALAPVAWLIAASWPLIGKRPFGMERLPPVGDLIIVLGTLTLPQFAAAVQSLPLVPDNGVVSIGGDSRDIGGEEGMRNITVLTLLVASAYVGLLWRPKMFLICAAAFYVPYVVLYTTFFTNLPGFWSGIWGSLDYWLAQHHVQRGNQPRYYYGIMTSLYEFLPLALALGGAYFLARRGDSLRRWLLFWTVGIFVGLTFAGEKMPWLELHIALPLTLVGALSLSMALDAVEMRERRWLTAAGVAALTAVAVLVMVEGDGIVSLAGLMVFAALAGWAVATYFSAGKQAFGRAALAIGVAALLTLTVRASINASYANDDTPIDMLVYVQSTPDITALRDRIDTLARESGLGHNLPLVIDTTDGFSWPWAWYLRDYHDKQYISSIKPDYVPPAGAVLLIARSNAGNFNGAGYAPTPYKHRWWFNEEGYRSYTDPACLELQKSKLTSAVCTLKFHLNLSKTASTLTSVDGLEMLGKFFLYRRTVEKGVSSVDAVAYFPESLAAFDTARRGQGSAVAPKTQSDGRIVIGQLGLTPGELYQPADVFVDGQGNIWVADSRNNRVQKFDSGGNFVTAVGGGSGQGITFNEPWSVAVDGDGFVYVADSWNHRIVKLSPELQAIASWGVPATKPNPGPLELFGPRDIVIASDGTLWVTDTGNKRLVHYTRDGEPLGSLGKEGSALGDFLEPVGLARDAGGRLLIADAWNGRIQRLTPDAGAPTSFVTGWTSRDVLAKPYLAVLSDGRIVASDPVKGVLMLWDAEGRPLGSWKPESDGMPAGVAALGDGGFVFSDIRKGTLQIVPGGLVGSLFK